MVSGSLREKRGLYYCVLSYKDIYGKRKQKWISTGLPVKGNKKRAEEVLMEVRKNFKVPKVSDGTVPSSDMLFADFLTKIYLPSVKENVELSTYSGYAYMAKRIDTYFREHCTTIGELDSIKVQRFYNKLSEDVSASTVKHYHCFMHAALAMAVQIKLISSNPSDNVNKPKAKQFIPSFYSSDEINALCEATKDDDIRLLIKFTAFYGLRKSEALGLKWSAIDFDNDTFVVNHTVTSTVVNGKKTIVKKDRTKRKSSYRTMPLVPEIKEVLLALKEKQSEYRRMCKDSYNKEDRAYVFVDAMGNLFNPNYVTEHFDVLLRRYGMRRIRFHDLRHSSASLLLAAGVPIVTISDCDGPSTQYKSGWLRGSVLRNLPASGSPLRTNSTTANIYAHLESDSKKDAALALNSFLGMKEEKIG